MSVTERQKHTQGTAFYSQYYSKKNGLDSQQQGHKAQGQQVTALGQQDSCLLLDALPDCHSCFQQVGVWRPFISLTYCFPSVALSISGTTA